MSLKEHGDYSQRDYDENEEGTSQQEDLYSNRVHSMHRNRKFKSPDDLILEHEARVGGTGVRTLGRNKHAGK